MLGLCLILMYLANIYSRLNEEDELTGITTILILLVIAVIFGVVCYDFQNNIANDGNDSNELYYDYDKSIRDT